MSTVIFYPWRTHIVKILVISDTHGFAESAAEIIKAVNPDYTFHLGDMADDCHRLEQLFPDKIITSVRGNNDFFDDSYPFERVTEIGGKKIFACHGHHYHVKSGLESLEAKADEVGADIVLYGHTHVSYLDITDKRIVMNPGSMTTYGIIEISEDTVSARIERI